MMAEGTKRPVGRYLSEEKLRGFEKYKYNSIDTCVLSVHVMHPFWNWCVQFCPPWLAPNVLTLTGFLLTVLNFLLFAWYDYGFYGNSDANSPDDYVPSWVWAFTSVSLFLAYTLDGVDGKQARKTGTSGPLGELFDHGLDSYSAVLIPIYIYSIFGRNAISPLRMYFVIWNICLNFYLTHWEKYNTGVMFLPWGYDFTMIGAVLILLVTSLTGPKAWDIELPGGITIALIFELTLYFSAMLTSQTIIAWNIYKSYRYKTGKMRSFPEAVRPLVPLICFFIISSLWAVKSPNNLMDVDPRAFYVLTGTIFSNISCRLIVSQMSSTRCELFNDLLWPLALCTALALSAPLCMKTELTLLYGMCILASVTHIHYGTGVVQEMCQHYNIKCFRVKCQK